MIKQYSTLSEALKEHTPDGNPDPSGTKIMRYFQKRFPTATHAVLFVNQDFSSSQFGAWRTLAIGPDQTYKTLAEVDGQHLYDLPSQRMYPVASVAIIKEA